MDDGGEPHRTCRAARTPRDAEAHLTDAGRLRAAGLAATAAAVAASAGDLGLLWVANAARTDLAPIPTPPAGVLEAGHFLGVLGIPLYALGYWQIARGLAPVAPRAARWVALLGAYAAALGCAVHGMTALVVLFEQREGVAGADPVAVVARWAGPLAPLWLVLAGLSVTASALYAVTVARGGTAYPRWMAALNPILLVLLAALLAAGSPWLQAFLVPAAPNLAHIVLFALATVTLRPGCVTRSAGESP